MVWLWAFPRPRVPNLSCLIATLPHREGRRPAWHLPGVLQASSCFRPGHHPPGNLSLTARDFPGLTLVELLFAVSITAFALLGVAGMFPAASASVLSGGQVTKATNLAQAMVDRVRSDPFDTLVSRYNFTTNNLGAACPVTTQSGSDPDYGKKKWKCDILATGATDSGRGLPGGYGTVFVACVNPDGLSSPCPTDLLQLTVTVSWGLQGSRSVSLVTYVARTE